MTRRDRKGQRRPDPVMAIVDAIMDRPGVREDTKRDWERNRQMILARVMA